jgi:ubiquinol-cytochrome c reductase cytochrome c subunit
MTSTTPRRPGPRRHHAARLVAVALVVATAAMLTLLGGRSADPQTASATTTRATGAQEETGRRVFLRDCAWCHGDDGTGTENGPSLADAGEAGADFYLRTGRMPLSSPEQDVRSGPPAYDDATITALVEHVGTLGEGPSIPDVGEGDPAAGRRLFLSNCAACHSSSGTGTIVPGGDPAPELWHTDEQQIAEAMRVGPGSMPPFGEGQLDQSQADDIVAYVDQLGEEQARGGRGLDQYGPIVEGAVALGVLLTLMVLVARLLGKRAPGRKSE